MKKICWVAFVAFFFITCKHKKPSLSGEEPVTVEDFIESFKPLSLPYQLTDSDVNKKEKDSSVISYKIFTQFVPDTVAARIFGKNARPKIYPLGRIEVSKDEKYLVSKTVLGEKKAVFLICFNRNDKYAGALPFLRPDADKSTQQLSLIDKKITIHISVLQKNKNGTVNDGKEVYIYNGGSGNFMLIMTDALNENVTELINPIDTLAKKNKFSGDYVIGKNNIVSIRDGRKPTLLSFFVHFEKNKGDCVGELKGEGTFTTQNTAIYRSVGDPCVLQFSFSQASVTLKEIEGCGSRRGMKCVFDGVYPKKKVLKPKATKKKTVKK